MSKSGNQRDALSSVLMDEQLLRRISVREFLIIFLILCLAVSGKNFWYKLQTNVGYVFLTHQNYQTAEQHFKVGTKATSTFTTSWRGLGAVFRFQMKPKQALHAYDLVLHLNPKDEISRLNRAFLRQQLGNQENAKLDLLALNSPDLLIHLGTQAVNIENMELAVEYFKLAADTDPSNLPARYYWAATLYLLRRNEEAKNVLMQMQPHFDKLPGTLFLLGQIEYSLGLYSNAYVYFEQYIADNPLDFAGWIWLGLCTKGMGDAKTAKLHFKKAAQLNPNDHSPYFHLGQIFEEEKQFQYAEREYEVANKLLPNNAEILAALDRVRKLSSITK